jgi:hypothetical protein
MPWSTLCAQSSGTRSSGVAGSKVRWCKGRLTSMGWYRSTVFPGLWLDPAALLTGDTRQLRAVVDMGCATPEYSAFLALLARRGFPS